MRDPQALVDTQNLSAALGDPDLRVFDCTTYLDRLPSGSDQPYNAVSGRKTFEAAHIPGADFLDLQGEFSDRNTPLHFMMPDVAQLETAFGRHGIGEGTKVVLYSMGTMMWATRFWWMLKSLGFDNVAVLDGGFDKWKAEGQPTQSGAPSNYEPATFNASPRPGFFIGMRDVMAALDQPDTVIVNALSPTAHKGREPSSYGRPGRIPGSVNVYGPTLAHDDTKCFIDEDEARILFANQGVTKDKRVICYCGGGISATLDLFMLYQLGYPALTLYDGSMGEWAKDATMPIETD